MAFNFGNLFGGGLKGAAAGSPFGLPGALIGGALGAGTGAFSKDIDKKVTGNSSSGATNNLLGLAGLLGGGASLIKGMSGGSNPLASLFGGGSGSSSGFGGGSGGGSGSGSSLGGNLTNAFSGMSNPITKQQSSQGFGLGNITGSLTKNPLLTGLGTMLGSQFIGSPKVPELPQSVIDFQNAAKAGNPLQNQASSALQQQLGQTQQNLGQPEIDALNRQYDLAQEQELKQIDSMYKSLRPGSDPLTDTSYQKDLGRVRDRYATLRADSTAQAQRQISNDFNSQRANQIAQAAGLGQQQLQQLATLSQYDLDRQLSQLNIDYADKSTLRNYLLQLGGNIASSGFPQQNPLAALFGQKAV